MKKFIICIFLSAFSLSCANDDWKDDLEDMQTELDEVIGELANQKKMIEVLQKNATVQRIILNDGYYTIQFSDGQSITLSNGKTPLFTIGENGNWFIDGKDSGKLYKGRDNQDGDVAYSSIIIGENGNWFINSEDTGVKVSGIDSKNAQTIASVIDIENEIIFVFSDRSAITVNKSCKPNSNFVNRFLKESQNLIEGQSISISTPDIKFNQTIGFRASVKDMGKIKISHGKILYAAGVLDIDSKTITTYNNLGVALKSYPHNLNIQKFIQVLITVKTLGKAEILIQTLNSEFKMSIPFNGSRDDVVCDIEEGVFSNCILSFGCTDFNKDIWMFGDSYFDFIPQHLESIGFDNALFDAFSGRGAAEGLVSLKKMIGVVGIPKIIYWALGMNNCDSNSKVNEEWLSTFEELKQLCRKYNVTLIPTTIPNVPNRNHNFKNQIIHDSGLRYVDINKCVGADISVNWFDGLLHTDQVHPTDQGAKVIANFISINIPELRRK